MEAETRTRTGTQARKATMHEMIKAIREHPLVGNQTCSVVAECWGDSDLIGMLKENKISTVKEAIKFALDAEELFLEDGLNQRWGEDSDPQLKAYREFKSERKERNE